MPNPKTIEIMENIRWTAASFDRACSHVFGWLVDGYELDTRDIINDAAFKTRYMMIRNYAPGNFTNTTIPHQSMRMINVLSSAFKAVQMAASRFKGRCPADRETWVKDVIVATITETMGERVEAMKHMDEVELARYSFQTLTAEEIEEIAIRFARKIATERCRHRALLDAEPPSHSLQ